MIKFYQLQHRIPGSNGAIKIKKSNVLPQNILFKNGDVFQV